MLDKRNLNLEELNCTSLEENLSPKTFILFWKKESSYMKKIVYNFTKINEIAYLKINMKMYRRNSNLMLN